MSIIGQIVAGETIIVGLVAAIVGIVLALVIQKILASTKSKNVKSDLDRQVEDAKRESQSQVVWRG